MAWSPKRRIWDWRKFLTPDEARFMVQADRAADQIEELRAAWERKFARERSLIVNRAIQRAKYETAKAEANS